MTPLIPALLTTTSSRPRHRGLDLHRLGHVGQRPDGRVAEFAGPGPQLVLGQADQADPRALGREGPRGGHADAALAAGDEGGLTAQLHAAMLTLPAAGRLARQRTPLDRESTQRPG